MRTNFQLAKMSISPFKCRYKLKYNFRVGEFKFEIPPNLFRKQTKTIFYRISSFEFISSKINNIRKRLLGVLCIFLDSPYRDNFTSKLRTSYAVQTR